MKCIILAAGRGTRMGDITKTIPKPLIPIGAHTLLDYCIGAVIDYVDSIVIIIEYLAEKIETHIQDKGLSSKVTLVYQTPGVKGTMAALLSAKNLIDENFIVMCADNLYDPIDIQKLIEKQNSILLKSVTKEEYNLSYRGCKALIESNLEGYINLDTGVGYFEKSFIDLEPVETKQGELGIPHTIHQDFLRISGKYSLVFTNNWIPVGTEEQLKSIENQLEVIKWIKSF